MLEKVIIVDRIRVKAICAATHTAAVVSAYQAAQAAQEV
jgi:hypothetical protein